MTTAGAQRADGAAILEARGLELARGGKRLVQGLDLELRPGQCWCLLGPNGSGKTSLLHALAGLCPADAGDVRLLGRTYAQLGPREAARRRGILLQSRHFAFRMSVRECVMLGRHPHLDRFDWPGQEDHARVDSALDAMDMRQLADRDVFELSGGEQQRTNIAALLVQDTRLLLLDEPTTHLDFRHQAALFAHLCAETARAGRAVVFSTHDLGIAARFATHALLLCGEGRTRQGACEAVLKPELLSTVYGFELVAVDTTVGRVIVPRW